MQLGEVSEWSMEAVLKTVKPKGFVGSNPTFSAINHSENCHCVKCMAEFELWKKLQMKKHTKKKSPITEGKVCGPIKFKDDSYYDAPVPPPPPPRPKK